MLTTFDGTRKGQAQSSGICVTLVLSALVAAMGGLLFGFDTAVIAGAIGALKTFFSLSPKLLGLTVSSALWGTIFGALVSAHVGDRWGRRTGLFLMAALYLISAGGCAFAWNWSALLIFRVIGGVGIGGSSVLGPMYIAEISPSAWRGRLVTLFQLSIVVGILLAYLSNYFIATQRLGLVEWRWELGASGVPAIVFLLLLFFIPESPRWFLHHNRLEEAHAALRKIGESDPEATLLEIDQRSRRERQSSGASLLNRRYLFPIFLAVSMGLFCQLSGINAILYYLNDIFAAAGFTRITSGLQAVTIGTTNLVFTALGMVFIDKIGRRTLLLIGSVGMCFALAGVAWVFQVGSHMQWLLWMLITFCGFFSFSEGAVMWVYIGEIFPTHIRAKGLSLGSISHWIMNAIISGVFPIVAERSRAYPFWFFAAMMALQFVVVFLIFPETKGASLETNAFRLAKPPSAPALNTMRVENEYE